MLFVSILVPVYNVEKYLRPCLDSILAQTLTNFEAVLVDDGSTDSSGSICDEYAAKDNRFVVIHKQNEGSAKARITAFNHCKGDVITFVDSDDYLAPDYLEKLSKPILEDDADMVSCSYIVVENGKEHLPPSYITGAFQDDQILDIIYHYPYNSQARFYGIPCYLWTMMVKRSFVNSGLRQGNGIWLGEDQIAVFAMLYQVRKLSLIADRLYYYVQHEGQITKKYDITLWDSIIKLLERYEEIDVKEIAWTNIRKRGWLHIGNTVYKMAEGGMHYNDFNKHISYARNQPYMKCFFKPYWIDLGIGNNIKYWLLKYKLYYIYYILLVIYQKLKKNENHYYGTYDQSYQGRKTGFCVIF